MYRLNEQVQTMRFPVFIRQESQHRTPLTGLLTSLDQLEAAKAKLSSSASSPDDLMIVEFGNRPYADGLFRKYGAYHIGGIVYGQHCFVRQDWHIKEPERELDKAKLIEHEDYVARNPHAEELADIFSRVGIDYGRVDYCVVDGRIQIFEINTNPTILDRGPETESPYDNRSMARIHESAVLRLEREGDTFPIPIPNRFRAKGRRLSVDKVHRASLRFSRRKHARHLRRERMKQIKSRLRDYLFSGN